MADCGCGSGSNNGATQAKLEVWAQLYGAGRYNDPVFAMTASGWPGIKIGSVSHQLRGPRTPIYRRTGADESTQCGEREGGKGANKITVDFAACGCGSMDVSEFIGCNRLDLYQTEICCADQSGRFAYGWSKVRVWRGVSFDSAEYANNVSYLQEDDADLTISYPGLYRDQFTLYPLTMAEQTALIATGGTITDARYFCGSGCGSASACGCGCDDCADGWVGITAAGLMIYKMDRVASVKSVSVTGWPVTATSGLVAYWGGYFWAVATTPTGDQIFRAKCSDPTTWTTYTPGATLQLSGFICTRNALIGYGQCGVSGTLYDLGNNQDIASSFCRSQADCAITLGGYHAAIICGNRVYTVGGCLGDNADETVTTLAARDCELWAGTDAGTVRVSTDGGDSWEALTIGSDLLANVIGVTWANSSVGYLAAQTASGAYKIYSTINGGNVWTEERIDVPSGATITKISIPCCSKNETLRVNRLLIAGTISGRGTVWIGQPICTI